MLSNFSKYVLAFILTSIISILLLISGYEIYKRFFWYENWKSNFTKNEDWRGRLTMPSKNKVLMWDYQPYGVFEDSKLGYKIQVNRYGFRDYDYESLNKPDDVYRVAFIGDSTVLGLKVKDDAVFVKQFENLANKIIPKGKVQALNFGIDGYNTIQIYELLKTKIPMFSPDKVVYALNLNDFDLWNASGDKILYFRKPIFFTPSYIHNFVRRRATKRRLDYYHFYFRMNKHTVFEYILKMRDMLDERGIGFQVVILPTYEYNFNDYVPEDIHDAIRNYLLTNRIEVFDLLPQFKKQHKPPSLYLAEPEWDKWHPNEKGHRLIAQGILQPVLSHYLSQ